MKDNEGELVVDVEVARRAATLTNQLMGDLKARRRRRNRFSVRVQNTAISHAREVVEGEKDTVTGLLLSTVMRRNVAERLKNGEEGTIVVLDMVGLKHFNTFSHETGNNGLTTMAKVLQEFGFAELGRKGDEFYGFMTGMDEGEFRTKFKDFIGSMQAADQLTERETGIQILSYWDCGYIDNSKDLNGLVGRLDKQTENVKAQVAKKVLQMIDAESPERKPELMMLYFNLKIRANPGEIAQFINSLDEQFRQQHGITERRGFINEDVLGRIPQALKHDFYEFQRAALRELNLN